MIQVALVDSFGEIKSIMSAASDGAYGDREAVGSLTAIHVAPDADINYMMTSKYWNGNSWQDKPQKPGKFYNWTAEATWVFNSEEFMRMVRNQRNNLLFQSDWTQLPDANVDSAAWATYRQALRDFPGTITTETSLEELVWPVQP